MPGGDAYYMLTPFLSLPEVFRGRRVVLFVDNTSAIADMSRNSAGTCPVRVAHNGNVTLLVAATLLVAMGGGAPLWG